MCPVEGCPPDGLIPEPQLDYRQGRLLWSDASTWSEAGVDFPDQDGIDVVIPAGWDVVLDTNTPRLNRLTIAGTPPSPPCLHALFRLTTYLYPDNNLPIVSASSAPELIGLEAYYCLCIYTHRQPHIWADGSRVACRCSGGRLGRPTAGVASHAHPFSPLPLCLFPYRSADADNVSAQRRH